MKVLRRMIGLTLNEGSLMASGLYNLYNDEDGNTSDWFDKDECERLLGLGDVEFYLEGIRMIDECILNNN